MQSGERIRAGVEHAQQHKSHGPAATTTTAPRRTEIEHIQQKCTLLYTTSGPNVIADVADSLPRQRLHLCGQFSLCGRPAIRSRSISTHWGPLNWHRGTRFGRTGEQLVDGKTRQTRDVFAAEMHKAKHCACTHATETAQNRQSTTNTHTHGHVNEHGGVGRNGKWNAIRTDLVVISKCRCIHVGDYLCSIVIQDC